MSQGGEFGEVYVEHRISSSMLPEEGKFKSAVFGISQEKLILAAEVASFVTRGTKSITSIASSLSAILPRALY